MAKQKSIGLTIFAVCCLVYGRTAFLAPTEDELQDAHTVETSRSIGAEEDPLGLLHGVRYYILALGGLGLLIAVEDHFMEKAKKKTVPPTQTPDSLLDTPSSRK